MLMMMMMETNSSHPPCRYDVSRYSLDDVVIGVVVVVVILAPMLLFFCGPQRENEKKRHCCDYQTFRYLFIYLLTLRFNFICPLFFSSVVRHPPSIALLVSEKNRHREATHSIHARRHDAAPYILASVAASQIKIRRNRSCTAN